MLEVVMLFVFGVSFQLTFFYSHPLVLGMGLLCITVCLCGMMCFYCSIFGFCAFMVMVAGVLVVFAYTISLVPYEGAAEWSTKFKDEKVMGFSIMTELFNIPKLGYKVYADARGSVGNLQVAWAAFTVFGYLGLCTYFSYQQCWHGEDISSMILSYSEIGYFSEDYAFIMLWLGVLFFLVMVFSMSVASCYQGALIM